MSANLTADEKRRLYNKDYYQNKIKPKRSNEKQEIQFIKNEVMRLSDDNLILQYKINKLNRVIKKLSLENQILESLIKVENFD